MNYEHVWINQKYSRFKLIFVLMIVANELKKNKVPVIAFLLISQHLNEITTEKSKYNKLFTIYLYSGSATRKTFPSLWKAQRIAGRHSRK